MSVLKVRFQRENDIDFHDISSVGVFVSTEFMEELTEATKKSENYKAVAAGISEVSSGSQNMEGANFFVVGFEERDERVNFLFELLPGETSRLVGVSPLMENKRHIKNLLNKVVGRKLSGPVRIII